MMRVHRKAGAESLQNWSAWAMWRGWWQRTWVYRSEVSLQPVDKAVSTSAWFFWGGGRGAWMPDAPVLLGAALPQGQAAGGED